MEVIIKLLGFRGILSKLSWSHWFILASWRNYHHAIGHCGIFRMLSYHWLIVASWGCRLGSRRLYRLGVSQAKKSRSREMSARGYALYSVCPNCSHHSFTCILNIRLNLNTPTWMNSIASLHSVGILLWLCYSSRDIISSPILSIDRKSGRQDD